MYNIHKTVAQKYNITYLSDSTKSVKSIKRILNNTNLVQTNSINTTKKSIKLYPNNNLSYITYLAHLDSIKQKNLIKCYIKITLNNIFVTYNFNNQIKTISLASLGFKGKSKQTAYAFKTFAETLVTKFLELNSDANSLIINIYAQSLNHKLKIFLKIFKTNNLKINKIYDITPIPYNGCRKKKISIKKKKNL